MKEIDLSGQTALITGVTANAICPGTFRTQMNERLIGTPAGPAFPDMYIPMRRFGEMHEIRPAVLFLARPVASSVTGAAIGVDGRWTAF